MRKKHLAKFRSYAAVSPFGHNCLAFWVTTNCLCVCLCARVCVYMCVCLCECWRAFKWVLKIHCPPAGPCFVGV